MMSFLASITECEAKAKIGEWVSSGPDAGSKQCAVAVKALAGAPETIRWRRGRQVKGDTTIRSGTAIATFPTVNGKHFNYKGHAAIYVSQTAFGIYVYDQWSTKPFGKRLIKFKCGGYVGDDGDAFHVIELTEYPSSTPAVCGPTSYYDH
jgi:hypothetical protein